MDRDDADPDIALILAAYAAFAAGDIKRAVASLHPQVEWIEPDEFPDGGRRSGQLRSLSTCVPRERGGVSLRPGRVPTATIH